MSKVNIEGLDKAELFAALYNNAKPLGMGMLRYNPTPLTKESAAELMGLGDDSARMFPGFKKPSLYFDYVNGRPMKINLEGDETDSWGYNRDQGEGEVERIVAELRGR